jgi:hypothetical protein
MVRVYLDWNIFSYLRHFGDTKEPYISLNRHLTNHKSSILIPYTSAHLTDLIPSYKGSKKGKEETKHDLNYLAEITDHNCILYDYKEKKTYSDRYDLHEYFEQLLESDQFQFGNVEGLFSSFDAPELAGFSKSLIDLFKVIPAGIDMTDYDTVMSENSPFYSMMANTIKSGSFYDVFNDTINMIDEYNNNHKAYRGIRNASLEHLKLNFDYSTSEDPIEDISKHLKSSGFKKTFKEFSDTTLKNYFGDKEPSRFDIFTNHYLLLDFLGFYKDQRFKNLLQDAFHAYYGAHCEFFVTDDRNTYQKAKVIYDQFNIETVVCTSEEFNSKFFGKVILNTNNDAPITEILSEIINTGFVISKKHDSHFNPIDIYRIDHYVLNSFNRLQITHNIDGSFTLYLYKKNQNYSQFYFWKEIEFIVNSIVGQFGPDLEMRTTIDLASEKTEIRKNEWTGRTWENGNTKISVVWDTQLGIMLTFDINPSLRK